MFETHRVLPGSIHCYDMAKFDGKTFFCGSVEDYEKDTMIAYYDDDNPDNIKPIKLYKDGKTLRYRYRVYDMFIFKDTLYAWHLVHDASGARRAESGLYAYNPEQLRFEYCEGLSLDTPVSRMDLNVDFMIIGRKFEYKENMVFIVNGLFHTQDLKSYRTASLGEDFIASDYLFIDGELYILAYKKNDAGGYTNAVFYTENLDEYSKVMYFDADTYMKSFEYCADAFYFGAGTDNSSSNKACGGLYRVALSQLSKAD